MRLWTADELLARRGRRDAAVEETVTDILRALRADGSRALARFARELDGVEDLRPLGPSAMAAAFAAAPPPVQAALRTAAERIRAFQLHAVPHGARYEDGAGNCLSLRLVPLQRVGVLAPGGRAPYPSSLLMAAVTARVAGVAEVIVCSPRAHPLVLAAAHVAGVDAVFPVGGAQAVGAMAFGVAPLPRVDKIVGPGNAYVVEAKRQVFGTVGIDGLPGPSEIVVVADDTADPRWVRADLAAQAEHGHEALVVLITPDRALAEAVDGDAVLTASLAEAVALADALAPEHLSLQCRDAAAWAGRIRNAGLVCVGPHAPVAAADYAAGTNHVLPTEGTARFGGGLTAADFCKRVQVFEATAAGVAAWRDAAAALADAEGFAAHAASIRLRVAEPAPAPAAGPYVPEPAPGAALLDLNENPYPWPAAVWEDAVVRLRRTAPHRYPRREAGRLVEAIAAYAGVPPDWVAVGNGGDELIVGAIAGLAPRIRRVVFPTPTFGMYRRVAEALGLEAVGVPLGEGWSLDETALRNALAGPGEAALVLCRPNNPTGNLWPREQVLRLCELPGVWPIVDEAYWEFAGEHLAAALPGRPRLLLIRTLSKAFAAAGLRVGYALGTPERLRTLVLQPWPVGRFDQAGAEAALAHVELMRTRVAAIVAERERLRAALGGRAWPSAANFLLFRAGPGVEEGLRARGVSVRRYPDAALAGCLRVSVGSPEENDRFLAALGEVLA